MAENLVNDDKSNPPIAGEINRLLNRYPAPGQPAAAIPNPTPQAGKITIGGSLDTVTITGESLNKPGKRLSNPLSNFSSYTYKISLYMITPDAYNAFVESGRSDINAINKFGQNSQPTTTMSM
jgi:hypothetical protein